MRESPIRDPVSGDSHLIIVRTTGYTATMIARLLAEGLWKEPGVFAPEFLGRNTECVRFILEGLQGGESGTGNRRPRFDRSSK